MIPMILQAEFAKALGQAISRRLPQNHKKEILCLDQVNCGNGDFIDIGRPLEGGIAAESTLERMITGVPSMIESRFISFTVPFTR